MLPLRTTVDLGAMANEGVLSILQRSGITGSSQSDCLVSYQDTRWGSFTPLQRTTRCILQLQPTGQSCLCVILLKYVHRETKDFIMSQI